MDTPNRPITFADLALAFAATLLLSPLALPLVVALGSLSFALVAVVVAAALYGAIWLASHTSRRGPRLAKALIATSVFVVMPLHGLLLAQTMMEPSCVVNSCGASGVPRPLHMPEGWGLLLLHVVAAVGWRVSRRRPEALPARAEVAVIASMLAGAGLHATLTFQFIKLIPGGIVIPVLGWAAVGPPLALVFLYREALQRLRRRGAELASASPPEALSDAYRAGPLAPVEVTPRVHKPLLLKSLALTPALLAAQELVQRALWGGHGGIARTFTETCAGPLSQLTRVVEPAADCHYLCTVAAQGHPWLVGPERMGVRNGHPIVVNRQLATANAFEDLLRERWPRFARLARRVYDALGYPVSRHLKSRWSADLMYLAMKPAEWGFYLALLLLDRGAPEARLDRMYRDENSTPR
ncbi:MAG: DUF6688 family protein [Polyangiales bacterium]